MFLISNCVSFTNCSGYVCIGKIYIKFIALDYIALNVFIISTEIKDFSPLEMRIL